MDEYDEYKDHGRPVHVTGKWTDRYGTLHRTLRSAFGSLVFEVHFGPDKYGGREIRRISGQEQIIFLDKE